MAEEALGTIAGLWRYPVKSMMGEEINASAFTKRGVLGDRAYALLDPATGKVVSAKNPRRWGRMFEFRASFASQPEPGAPLPPVRITLPDRTVIMSDRDDVTMAASQVFGHDLQFVHSAPARPSLEEYWPDIEGLSYRETVTDEAMPADTFFDASPVHIVTTSTIDALREAYPQGRFEARRFRPNVIVETAERGFVENGWVGRTLRLGDQVALRVEKPCGRCVMTTLPQGDLPQDYGILKTAAKRNKAIVGVYASVVGEGTVRRGDPVRAA
jgi:hypothetical protein